MRECLSIHLGQCGTQIGDITWQLLTQEHGIQPDGQLVDSDSMEELTSSQSDRLSAFFQESYTGRYTPRSLFIDLEPSVIDSLFQGERRQLYSKDHTLSGKEDAANNFARGFYSLGKEIIEPAVDLVGKALEACDSFQGFLIYNSFGGGTGSGFTSLLLQELYNIYNRRPKLEFAIAPSPHMSTAVVEPYNAVLRGFSSLRHSDCVFMMDNESIYNIARTKLDVERPACENLNALVAQVISSMSSSLRFDGILNVDLEEFQTNLVPFPRIHFPVVSYSPFISKDRAYAENLNTKEITRECFETNGSKFLKCSLEKGKYMACCFLYRGDVLPKDVNASIAMVKARKDVQFVDWCPTGIKVGINGSRPIPLNEDQASVPRALCTLTNNTAVGGFWQMLGDKFDLMFTKRAFVHWYLGEGMEEGEFTEAREELSTLTNEYRQLEEGGCEQPSFISMGSDY